MRSDGLLGGCGINTRLLLPGAHGLKELEVVRLGAHVPRATGRIAGD